MRNKRELLVGRFSVVAYKRYQILDGKTDKKPGFNSLALLTLEGLHLWFNRPAILNRTAPNWHHSKVFAYIIITLIISFSDDIMARVFKFHAWRHHSNQQTRPQFVYVLRSSLEDTNSKQPVNWIICQHGRKLCPMTFATYIFIQSF